MSDAQVYCAVKDVNKRINKGGEAAGLLDDIRAASQFIQRHIGQFLPIHEARYVRANNLNRIKIGTALEIETVLEDGVAVTDYEEDPYGGEWRNGPVTYLERNDDATWDEKLTITSWWGLYNELRTLGISVTQLLGASILVASDGSVLSPGMVLRVEDEAEYVTAGNGGPGSPAATAATSKLSGAVDETVTEITVDNGGEFFAGEVLQIGTENMLLLRQAGNIWAVERSYNQTIATIHADDAAIGVYRTFAVERGVNGTTAAAHTSTGVSRFCMPDDVLYLAIEMTVLMQEKAGTNFGGRAGSTDAGETFFVNEFPKSQIEAVKDNYYLPYL